MNCAIIPQAEQGAISLTNSGLVAPSHEQVVAALIRFSAIHQQLKRLLAHTDLGKISIKAAIDEAAAELSKDIFLASTQIVSHLSKISDCPRDQRKWLRRLIATNTAAQVALLGLYRATNIGTVDWAAEELNLALPWSHL